MDKESKADLEESQLGVFDLILQCARYSYRLATIVRDIIIVSWMCSLVLLIMKSVVILLLVTRYKASDLCILQKHTVSFCWTDCIIYL